ncbi:PucR family transcriptional regulator [Oxobacter pfennigii]|nr:helix-turn-helix domain-containing protein [Oxobacter pfennigii]
MYVVKIDDELTKEEHYELSEKLNELLEATYSQRGLKQIVATGFEILKNPFFICDLYFNILDYTDCEIDEERLKWKGITQNVMDYNSLMRLKEEGAFIQVYSQNEPVVHNYAFNKMRSIAMRLEIKGKVAGHIVIYEYFKSFTKVDYQFIKYMAGAISNELMKDSSYSHAVTDVFDSYLMSLLNESLPADSSYKDGKMLYYDLKFKRNLCVLVMQTDTSTSKSFSLYYLKERLSELIYNSKMVVYNNRIIVFIENDNQEMLTKNTYIKLRKFIESNYIYSGMSNVFHDITIMKKHYYQSLAAIRFGQKYEHKYKIYEYKEYYLYDMFYVIEEHDELLHYCDPKLLELIEYDEKNGTNYAESLYTYISSGMDIAQSAVILNIHRNSLSYRIKRIEEIMSLDLKEAKLGFNLYLSFQMLAYCEKYPFKVKEYVNFDLKRKEQLGR